MELVLDLLAAGWSFEDVLANYQGLTMEDIRACIGYAKDVLQAARADERVLLTFDEDFGELALRRGRSASCGVVLFRVPMTLLGRFENQALT